MSIFDTVSKYFNDTTTGEALTAAQSISKIKDNFDQYIVRPVNAYGFAGFNFDYEGESTHNLKADITDHYVEDNSAVQDHIAINPERITLKSKQGELVYHEVDNPTPFGEDVAKKLTQLSNLLPTLSNAAQQAKNILNADFSLEGIQDLPVSSITDLWGLSKNMNPSATRQQKAFQFLKALHNQKMLVSLQTPFAFLTNYAIETIVATQPEESKYVSEFTITLKQIRVVSSRTIANPSPAPADTLATQTSNPIPQDYQANEKIQRQIQVDNGTTEGLPVDSTSTDSLTSPSGWIYDDSAQPE